MYVDAQGLKSSRLIWESRLLPPSKHDQANTIADQAEEMLHPFNQGIYGLPATSPLNSIADEICLQGNYDKNVN